MIRNALENIRKYFAYLFYFLLHSLSKKLSIQNISTFVVLIKMMFYDQIRKEVNL